MIENIPKKHIKIILFILIFFLIAWFASLFIDPIVENKQQDMDVKKTVACATASIDLEKKYPGSSVSYDDSTLIITLPLIAIAKDGGEDPDILREVLIEVQNEHGNIDEIMEEFIENFINKGQHVKSNGFFYIRVIIKDDFNHNSKEYSSSKCKI
jgi:hypothetical protein